jgi:uncharacterized membrane protein
MNETSANPPPGQPPPGLASYTQWIYALHSLAVLTGLVTGASVAGRFVFGLPSIIAVIMNYARRHEARGSYLESHFAWQIRTFWYALLALVVILLISAPLILMLGLGVLTAMAGFGIVGLWVIYRVARGWLALRATQPMPVKFA